MLRSLSIISIFLLASTFCFAQDTLYKTNHEKVLVKVQQVGPTEIIYKRYVAPDGPLYVISTSDVLKIVYIDGHVDLFTDEDGNENVESEVSTPFHSWTVGVNAFDMMFGMLSISGEYTSKKNDISLRIPLSCGVAAMAGNDPKYLQYYYYSKDKIFSTGLDLRFFPMKQKHRANYYLGVSFEYGMVNYKSYYYYWDGYYPPYESFNKTKIAWYMGTGITNGVLLKVSEHVNFGIEFTGGMLVTNVEQNSDYQPMARMGLTMGYRFGK